MLRCATIALAFAAAMGAGIAFAADGQNAAGDSRAPGSTASRAMPVKLFEGREAGPNELVRVCLVDQGTGRLRRCGARD